MRRDLPGRRRAENPVVGAAFDKARGSGIGFGLAVDRRSAAGVDHPPQPVAAVGLDYGVAILSGGEARSQGYHQRRVVDRRAGVDLGYDRIDHDLGSQLGHDARLRVNQNRYDFAGGEGLSLRAGIHPASDQPFDSGFAIVDRVAVTNGAAHQQGRGEFSHYQSKTAALEPVSGAAGQVAAAFHQNQDVVKASVDV